MDPTLVTSDIPIRPVINCASDFRRFGTAWVATLLQPVVANLWGIVSSSRQVTNTLRTTWVDEQDLLVTIDIKEFYLNINDEFLHHVISEFAVAFCNLDPEHLHLFKGIL